jgi:hypothetical protein
LKLRSRYLQPIQKKNEIMEKGKEWRREKKKKEKDSK